MQGEIYNNQAGLTKVRYCDIEPSLDNEGMYLWTSSLGLIDFSQMFSKKNIFYEDIHWPAFSFLWQETRKSSVLANGEQLTRPSLVSAWHRRWSFSLQLRGTRAGKVSRESWLPGPRGWKLHEIIRILLIHQVKSSRNSYVAPNQPEPTRTCNLLVCLWPEQICKQSRSLLIWAALAVSYARNFQLLHQTWSSEH